MTPPIMAQDKKKENHGNQCQQTTCQRIIFKTISP